MEKNSVDVEGPMQHHLYVGFCLSDRGKIEVDVKRLERLGVTIFPRFSLELFEEVDVTIVWINAVKERMMERTSCSRKCLLHVSDAYFQDQFYDVEIRATLSKAAAFTNDAVRIFADPPELTFESTFADLRRLVEDRRDDYEKWMKFAKGKKYCYQGHTSLRGACLLNFYNILFCLLVLFFFV